MAPRPEARPRIQQKNSYAEVRTVSKSGMVDIQVSNRKSQNSILFLTTLGVYLGLVFIGATPQVLAQEAATTKNFALKDEVELKDDLDKKPDDETSTLSESLGVYLQDVEYFLASLRNLSVNGKFDVGRDTFEVAQSTLLPCVAANKIGSYTANTFRLTNEALRPSLERFSKLLTDGYSLADCRAGQQFQGQEVTHSRFTFAFGDNDFSVQVSVKKLSAADAVRAAGALALARTMLAGPANGIIRQLLLEHTSFKSENDQVFVITRLPRAGLDSLLAKDAK